MQDPVEYTNLPSVDEFISVSAVLVGTYFGIQEYSAFGENTRAVFPGCPAMKDGYLYITEKPGWRGRYRSAALARLTTDFTGGGLRDWARLCFGFSGKLKM